MGKRDLYPNISTKTSGMKTKSMMDILTFCDGHHSINDINTKVGISTNNIYKTIKLFERKKIISFID